MTHITTAQAAVEGLVAHGVRTLYCLPGVQNDPFFDALYHVRDRITAIHARHEQGAAYMALGAALATGRPQALAVVPGPGLLNASAALATARSTGAPIVSIVGQIPSSLIGKRTGALHEIENQSGVVRSLSKWSAMVREPVEVRPLLDRAFREATQGRSGPTTLEVPVDVWTRTFGPEARSEPSRECEPQTTSGDLDEAARILARAQRPILLVGGGAQGACPEVLMVAEGLSAPVASFRMGKGVLDARHALSVHWPVAHRLWPRVDVALVVGSRFQLPPAWGLDGIPVIRIDIDPNEISRSCRPTVSLVGDAARVLAELAGRIRSASREDWSAEVQSVKAEVAALLDETLGPQMAYLRAIRRALPDDGIVCEDLTQIGYAARVGFDVHRPRTFLSTGYQGDPGMEPCDRIGGRMCAAPPKGGQHNGGWWRDVHHPGACHGRAVRDPARVRRLQ